MLANINIVNHSRGRAAAGGSEMQEICHVDFIVAQLIFSFPG